MVSLKDNLTYQRLLSSMRKYQVAESKVGKFRDCVRLVEPRFPTESDLNFHTTMRLHEKPMANDSDMEANNGSSGKAAGDLKAI